jgi:peptidoglycan/xylan/chitin deacetylase (PgdA/CDA1 family)
VFITFDDGYIDNYRLAFPILEKHGVQDVFFLPTAFVGTGLLPWWDVIAYVVKGSRNSAIRLEYPEPSSFDLARDGQSSRIMHILKLPHLQAVKTKAPLLIAIAANGHPTGRAGVA